MNFLKTDSLIFKDSLLTKIIMLLKKVGGANAFSHDDVEDYVFRKKDKLQNEIEVNNLIERADFLDKKIAALLSYKNRRSFENY